MFKLYKVDPVTSHAHGQGIEVHKANARDAQWPTKNICESNSQAWVCGYFINL